MAHAYQKQESCREDTAVLVKGNNITRNDIIEMPNYILPPYCKGSLTDTCHRA